MNGRIRLEEDEKTVLIENVQVQDEDLYQFLKEVEEDQRPARLVSAIRIGVVELRRMAEEELDYVGKEFNSLMEKFDKMFDPEVKTSHFGKLRKGFQEEFKELRDIIKGKEAKEELIETTTLKGLLKGFEFEDACEEILSVFVSKHMGDELERKTDEIGEITGSFAGDFLITLRDVPDKKIVLETKDWDTITQPKIIENLENAMRNRGAKYGIFVSKYREALPKKIGWFNEFRGNMLVCALGNKEAGTFFPEVLNIAYQWAKLRVKKEITIEKQALETLAEGIREIETRLDTFTQIKRQCTNVDKATKEIRELADDLRDSIYEQINKIQKAIAAVSEESNE